MQNNSFTIEQIDRAIKIQKELIQDMRSDEVLEENRDVAKNIAVCIETVVLAALRNEQERMNPAPRQRQRWDAAACMMVIKNER